MPELPELEAFRYYANKYCLKKKIIDIACDSKNLIKKPAFTQFQKNLLNKKFNNVQRQGKYLIFSVIGSDLKLVIHFGLTGTFFYAKKPETIPPFSHLIFTFEKGSKLFWINKRKFGKVWLVDNLSQITSLNKIGIDPLDVSKSEFIKILEKFASKNIKAVLMDQEIISGIGNEYSDEILFQSSIRPDRPIKSLSKTEISELYKKMNYVFGYAVKLRKKMIMSNDYDPEFFLSRSKKGFKKSFLEAHRHFDNKCPKNSKHILKILKIAGRTSYFCPEDQK
jgi:formamidopyrimidine-DNA glycosylase